MAPLLASFVSLMVLDLLFATVALVVGLLVGWCVFSGRRVQPVNQEDQDRDMSLSELALTALGRVRDLTRRVSRDVQKHSTEIGKVSDEAKLLQGSDSSDSILALIGRVVLANEQLQVRLADTEAKLQAQAEEIASHQTMARTDSLTGLSNRRVFDEEMARRLAEWQRTETPFAVMLVDVDYYKSFNDKHGHLTGDNLLRRLSDVITATVREMDIPCRHGGEEFAVVMPSTPLSDAKHAAERLRHAIEDMRYACEGQQLMVTASIGLSGVMPKDDALKLLRRTDQALYAAKKAGRNRSYFHDGKTCRPIRSASQAQSSSPPKPEFLLGLPDRQAFERELAKRIADSHLYGVPVSVMFVAVDGVEGVVEDHGQQVADLVLDNVATRLQDAIRDVDSLYRDKPKCFALILPGSTAEEAGQVARRIKTALSSTIIADGVEVRASIRVGLASCQTCDDLDSVCKRAEFDLHGARHAVLV